MNHPIAITGIGMVTAQGLNVAETWEGVVAGRDVLRPWKHAPADTPLAGLKVAQCAELPRPGDLPARLWNKLSRTQQLAAIAVDEALGCAGLPRSLVKVRTGLFLATTVCGMDVNERFYAQYRASPDSAERDLMRRIMPWEVAELLGRRHGIATDAGLRQVCMTTCVGSAMALANAMDALSLGECDIAIAGGAEALCRVVLSGFHSLKVVAADGCRPFDLNRPGITVGEGAGILVLERVEDARARGATVLAYLRGVGMTCDAHHLTAPEPGAVQAVAAMRDALARAGVSPGEVGYVNAHGTGTKDNDAMESRAIRAVFEAVPAVSSTKRLTGHTFGAAGAVEAILCVQALQAGVVPANAGTVLPEAGLVGTVRESVRMVKGVAVSTNFAFGGNNTAIVISGAEGMDVGEIRHAEHKKSLSVHGVGVVTDSRKSAGELGGAGLGDGEVLDANVVGNQDLIVRLAIRAVHEAYTGAGLSAVSGERVGLLFVSAWGTIDSTVAYLDSMLEGEGKFASPRHFSRSVYSSVASLTAIHFKVKGPCQTLAFKEKPVRGALCQARRMLLCGRAERVIAIWAEESAGIAEDLARRAVRDLGRKEFARYAPPLPGGLGHGAVAVVVGAPQTNTLMIDLEDLPFVEPPAHLPFASDSALGFVTGILSM